MKKFFVACALTLGVTAIAQTASAQGTASVPLSLAEATRVALDKNPTIKVAGMEIERVEWARKEVVGGFLPSLTGEGQYTRSIVQATTGGMKFGADNTVNLGGTATLPLIVPALWQSLKLNDEQMRVAVEASRKSKLDLVNLVQKAYYGILTAEQSLNVLRASEQNIKNTVDDTRTKLENELVSEYDLVTAEAQLSNLQPTIYAAESNINNVRRLLNMLLGMPLEVEVELTDKLDDLALTASQTPLYQGGVSGNSDLRAMDIQADMMQRQFKVMRTQRMPTLAAFGNVTFSGADQISNFGQVMQGAAPVTKFIWQHPISAGVKLSVPIFAGRTNIMRERQLKNSIVQLETSRNYFEQSVRVQVADAEALISTTFSQLKATANTIKAAEKSYQISQVRYNAGMGTILELNSAQLLLTTARLNYTQALSTYLSARADYDKITGKE